MSKKEDLYKKKLRPLVISMGGERQTHITEMFNTPELSAHFHPPTFSPGIPSRSIRNRKQLLDACYRANLLSNEEWEAIQSDKPIPLSQNSSRKGRKMDLEIPYSVEFWRKGKSLGRGRAVLACFLAHLIAIRAHAEDEDGGYDIILEDNVRPLINKDSKNYHFADRSMTKKEQPHENDKECECAKRIRETIDASESCKEPCHLRYYGWLGSIENVQYIYQHHIKSQGKLIEQEFKKIGFNNTSVFSFPTKCYDHKPGTAIWGAYAYWISPEAYHKALIPALRSDVGSILWKGKRMRQYLVKPIDKVIPRKVMEYMEACRILSNSTVLTQQTQLDNNKEAAENTDIENSDAQYKSIDARSIHVTTHPAFYRAPMLTSKIHTQWDVEFCKSTEVQFTMQSQLSNDVNSLDNNIKHHEIEENEVPTMSWKNLWLTEREKESVERRYNSGNWDAAQSFQSKNGSEENTNWEKT